MEFGKYQFLSWARRGLSVKINEVDTLGTSAGNSDESRASITVNVQVNEEAPGSQEFLFLGPGDITGIKSDMIIRTSPLDGISDFEPNLLSYIEFYDEDFPWRYTPAKATGEKQLLLRPWIALIVLKEGEFAETKRREPLPSIKVLDTNALPPHNELHLWAHGHSNLPFDDSGELTSFLDGLEEDVKTDPDGLFSRLICPRKLEPNLMYHAFLVPAYENGRLAGLGQRPTEKAQQPSWPGGNNEFPVYYRWHFRTGENFDFEYLVKLLEPRVMDKRIGQRPMNCSRPGFVRLNPPAGAQGPELEVSAPETEVIQLQGALLAPSSEPTNFPVDTNQDFLQEVEDLVNLNRLQLLKEDEDPYVTVPFYGMFHALRKDLTTPGKKVIPTFDRSSTIWYNDLNRDPRFRVPAGFGVRVVQENQEKLMDSAWKQLKSVLETNRKACYAHFMAKVADRGYKKNIEPLNKETLLASTFGLAKKIIGPSGFTVRGDIHRSVLPDAIFKPEFRRITRNKTSWFRVLNAAEDTFQYNNLVNQINTVGGLQAAPVVAYETLPIVSGVATFEAPDSLDAITVWSTQSNLEANFIYNRPAFVGGLPSTQIWNIPFEPGIIDIIIGGGELPDLPVGGGFGGGVIGGGPASGRVFSRSLDPTLYTTAFGDFNTRFGYLKPSVTPVTLSVDIVVANLKERISPINAFRTLLKSFFELPPGTRKVPNEDFLPAMAYPDFPAATYKHLVDIDEELLLPNLNLIPPNTLSLLRTNQKFIESYLVGLNYEMGRELLWREYPTDMRGSYFRQFWDVTGFVTPNTTPADSETMKDIDPIHTWEPTSELGLHNARDEQGDPDQLVFVVRGDLLKKFPNTVIYAQKAMKEDELFKIKEDLTDDEFDQHIKFPIYQAELPPDIKLLGFDLTIEEASGEEESDDFPGDFNGWFFILAEVPGEPGFGMDISFEPNKPDELTWNDLSWENIAIQPVDFIRRDSIPIHVENPDFKFPETAQEGIWGKSSADMATILLQRPVMVAVHSSEMLEVDVDNTNANTPDTLVTLKSDFRLFFPLSE